MVYTAWNATATHPASHPPTAPTLVKSKPGPTTSLIRTDTAEEEDSEDQNSCNPDLPMHPCACLFPLLHALPLPSRKCHPSNRCTRPCLLPLPPLLRMSLYIPTPPLSVLSHRMFVHGCTPAKPPKTHHKQQQRQQEQTCCLPPPSWYTSTITPPDHVHPPPHPSSQPARTKCI